MPRLFACALAWLVATAASAESLTYSSSGQLAYYGQLSCLRLPAAGAWTTEEKVTGTGSSRVLSSGDVSYDLSISGKLSFRGSDGAPLWSGTYDYGYSGTTPVATFTEVDPVQRPGYRFLAPYEWVQVKVTSPQGDTATLWAWINFQVSLAPVDGGVTGLTYSSLAVGCVDEPPPPKWSPGAPFASVDSLRNR